MVPPDYYRKKVQQILEGDDMTEKEIIRALRVCSRRTDAQTCAECPLFDSEDCMGDMMVGAADLIERLTAENTALREKVPRWISVDDRHPKPGTRVLATDGVFVGEAYRTSADTWRRYDGIAMRDCIGSVVTHWMPLAEAPKFADVLRGAPEVPEEGEKA